MSAPTLHADPRVTATLDRLHATARGDWRRLVPVIPTFLRSVLTRTSFMEVAAPARFANAYIPVSPEQGRFLYTMALATGARYIVEFGASFGISTIYLAAAARDNGGRVITTEIEPAKCRATEANLRDAGLDDVAQVLEGDAMQTLGDVDGPVDLLFLDGWKNLYLPVLELLRPKLRQGATVLADNVNFPDARPYLAHVRGTGSGYVSGPLFRGTTELSVLA